jgi:tetratricopeptide (TPR) repeat protein
VLYEALAQNGEQAEANKYLDVLANKSKSVFLALADVMATSENFADRVHRCDSLNSIYPNIPALELALSVKPLLTQDLQGFLKELERLSVRYPDFNTFYEVASAIYLNQVKNPELAYSAFLKSCRCSGDESREMIMRPKFLSAMGKYDDAYLASLEVFKNFPPGTWILQQLFETAESSNRLTQIVPLLEKLRNRYPGNIMVMSYLATTYMSIGRIDKSMKEFEAIHDAKPTAYRAYEKLDSLRGGVSFDSIFGSVDVMSLWDSTPSNEELAGADSWTILNRVQRIVFEGGPALSDFHMAWVLLNKDEVEAYQSMSLGFRPDNDLNKLLAATRLRKGYPPLAGVLNGDKVIFRDLQVGDAIELHYRSWSGQGGDLWSEFWDHFDTRRSFYQRHWEYTIYTRRSDLRYAMTRPASDPVVTEAFGFRKISWSGERAPGLRLNAYALPPVDEFCGRVFVTTLKDWETLRKWYRSVSDAVLSNNPRTSELSKQLTVGLTNELEKLTNLYRYVELNIPYQLIDFNYSGSIPKRPDDVLLNRWGDCKDKAHLLVHLLRSAGINAWTTLVLTSDEGSQMPLPQFDFNHLIVGCVVDGDTLNIDPSDAMSVATHSLTNEVAGQPCLPIKGEPVNVISSLPENVTNQYAIDTKLSLVADNSGSTSFSNWRVCHNLSAGNRRVELRGKADRDLMEGIATDFSSRWETEIKLDSISHDSIDAIDSVFSERWYGQMNLSIKKFGKTAVITLPDLSSFGSDLPSKLALDGAEKYPADLTYYKGVYTKLIRIQVPSSLGEPDLPAPVKMKDSLWSFEASWSWNKTTRVVSVSFAQSVDKGRCDRSKFIAFVNAANEAYKTPILFQRRGM